MKSGCAWQEDGAAQRSPRVDGGLHWCPLVRWHLCSAGVWDRYRKGWALPVFLNQSEGPEQVGPSCPVLVCMSGLFMHRVRGCLSALLSGVTLGRNTKTTLIWYLLLGEGLVITAWGFYECGLENSRRLHMNNLSSHLIIDRVAQE